MDILLFKIIRKKKYSIFFLLDLITITFQWRFYGCTFELRFTAVCKTAIDLIKILLVYSAL